jgi:hypothetical protein
MVDRAIDFFAPAFQLGNITESLERKTGLFDGSRPSKGQYCPTIRRGWFGDAVTQSPAEEFDATRW